MSWVRWISWAGPTVRGTLESVIMSLLNPTSSYTATVVGLIFLFIGAAGAFVQIRDAFRVIWGGWGIQAPVLESTLYTVIAYLLSFFLVLVVGMLLLLSGMISRIILPCAAIFFNTSATQPKLALTW